MVSPPRTDPLHDQPARGCCHSTVPPCGRGAPAACRARAPRSSRPTAASPGSRPDPALQQHLEDPLVGTVATSGDAASTTSATARTPPGHLATDSRCDTSRRSPRAPGVISPRPTPPTRPRRKLRLDQPHNSSVSTPALTMSRSSTYQPPSLRDTPRRITPSDPWPSRSRTARGITGMAAGGERQVRVGRSCRASLHLFRSHRNWSASRPGETDRTVVCASGTGSIRSRRPAALGQATSPLDRADRSWLRTASTPASADGRSDPADVVPPAPLSHCRWDVIRASGAGWVTN